MENKGFQLDEKIRNQPERGAVNFSDDIIKATPRRHFILLLFFITATLNNFTFSYAFIDDCFKSYYKTSDFMMSVTSNLVLIGFVIAVLPAIAIFETKGLRLGVLIGVVATTTGSWLFCASVSPNRFWLVMVAQTVVGLGQPFNLVVPTYLSSIWYPAEEVSRSCAVASLSAVFGNLFGAAIMPLIINEDDPNPEVLGKKFLYYHLGFACLCTTMLILTIIGFQKQPQYPPSYARAEVLKNPQKVDIIKSVVTIVKNRNFMVHFVSFGLIAGYLNSIFSLFNPILLSVHAKSDVKLWIIGFILTGSGLPSCVFAGYILDKLQMYKLVTSAFIAFCAIILSIFAITYHLGLSALYPTMLLLGILNAYWPIGLELSAEITYPTSEVVSTSFLFIVAYLACVIFTFLGTWVMDEHGALFTIIMYIIIAVASFILSLFVKPDYRRLEANKKTALELLNRSQQRTDTTFVEHSIENNAPTSVKNSSALAFSRPLGPPTEQIALTMYSARRYN